MATDSSAGPTSWAHVSNSPPTVTVGGELDLFTCAPLQHALDRLWQTPPASLTVDLEQVVYCGARGLRLLLSTAVTADREHVPLTLRGPGPQLARMLTLIGLGHLLRSGRPSIEYSPTGDPAQPVG